MTDLNLLYTELENDLRSSVRELLADTCNPQDVIAVCDGERELGVSVWQALTAEMGLGALLIPEDRGGAGASAREAAVVLEELGRAAAPVPFLTSSVIATLVLLGGSGEVADQLLGSLAVGTSTAALLIPLSTAPGAPVSCAIQGTNGDLTGEFRSVAGAVEATHLLVPVATAEGVEIYVLDVDSVTVTPIPSLDMTRQLADVRLDSVRGDLVVASSAGSEAIRQAVLSGAALLASEQLGVAQWSFETTTEYLKERRQFGRVVGGFQAIKHRLADLYVEIESSVAAARYAAATLAAQDTDWEVAATVAQAWCSDMAVHVTEEMIQLLGGIGMTWEHPAHLFLKRAKADQVALGTGSFHRNALTQLVDLH